MYYLSNELYHYGVLGMKWGYKKGKSGIGSLKTTKNKWSDDAKTVSELKKKNKKELSNADLKKVNERTQLERTYSNLNPSGIKKGMAFVVSAGALMASATTLYNNADNFVKAGKKVVDMLQINKVLDVIDTKGIAKL